MKILLISILVSISLFSFAQEKIFRVEQIVQIKTKWDNTVDTIVQKYKYENSKLTQIVITENGKETDIYNVSYNNNKVEVYNKNKWLQRSVQTDKEGKLIEFWTDGCDKFTLTYSGNQIQNIDRYDKCDKYSEGNKFEYSNGQLTKVKTFNKAGKGAYTTDYAFTYENNLLKKLVWGNNVDIFLITREDDKITKIEHSGFNKADWSHEFFYDENGNIKEETLYVIKDGKETISDKYFITYSSEKGNDDFIWSSYNWKYNIFLNQKTFKKHEQMRY